MCACVGTLRCRVYHAGADARWTTCMCMLTAAAYGEIICASFVYSIYPIGPGPSERVCVCVRVCASVCVCVSTVCAATKPRSSPRRCCAQYQLINPPARHTLRHMRYSWIKRTTLHHTMSAFNHTRTHTPTNTRTHIHISHSRAKLYIIHKTKLCAQTNERVVWKLQLHAEMRCANTTASERATFVPVLAPQRWYIAVMFDWYA